MNRWIGLFCLFLLAAEVSLTSLEIGPVVQATQKDLCGGITGEFAPYTAGMLLGGFSLRLSAEGPPVGYLMRYRQGFYHPRTPFEIGVTGELELFNPDAGFLILPSAAVDVGWNFTLWKQDVLLSLGYRYGFAEYLEDYEGTYASTSRINTVKAAPLVLALSWFP